MLPWFSVRALSACPRGAAMPLGASVLQCSWSSRWGHLSQVELCSSSVLDRHEGFPSFGWVGFLAFVRVPLPQAGAVFSHALVCIPSGCGHPLGQ